MTQSAKSLVEAARLLPVEEQAVLIDDLLVVLSHADPGWDGAWAAEADARWSQHKASGKQAHDGDTVLAEMRALLARRRARR